MLSIREKYTEPQKVDARSLAEKIEELPIETKERIFYIVQGAALIAGKAEKDEEETEKTEEIDKAKAM